MSHRLSKGKRRYLARLVFFDWNLVSLAVADMSPPGFGKSARREGRRYRIDKAGHHFDEGMSPPCRGCARRMPKPVNSAYCRRCLRGVVSALERMVGT